MADISGILPATGVALEAQAYRTFGAAVADQAGNVLNGIFKSQRGTIIDQNVNPIPQGNIADHGDWNVSRYAASMASGAGGYDPKTKFLFKVRFDFHEAAKNIAATLGLDVEHSLDRNLTYVVKQIDMPKYTLDYEEINMYNFRTKVLTRIKHEPLSFTFYDDVANNAIKFMNVYLQVLQPLARTDWSTGANLENHGFAFADKIGGLDSAMRAAIKTLNGLESKDVLRSLKIEQYYLNRGDSTHLTGKDIRQSIHVNVFTFTNPRITSFSLQDQDHESGATPNMMECQFDFDALHMRTGVVAETLERSETGLMEINDILSGAEVSGAVNLRNPSQPGGLGYSAASPFINIIANQGGRLVQTTIANEIHKSGLGSIAGGELANATSLLSGTLGTNAAKTLRTAGNGIAEGITAPKPPPVVDNSAGGSTKSQS